MIRLIAYAHRALAVAYLVGMSISALPAGLSAALSIFSALAAACWLGWQARGEHNERNRNAAPDKSGTTERNA